ncbi:ABC transporter permease [Aquabacter spiritensis]|uniref:Iron(III) transport system permease protein n=1 Tax=Aquabacter spiritensis TaxID=933073 RepID=A0A4R3M4S7_9HYPH|nr:iron ABC transporter permease [Aquabacter spiritensis]TCT08321.1 iron(III) transport system permease protein [Aquabacter spiritensis]
MNVSSEALAKPHRRESGAHLPRSAEPAPTSRVWEHGLPALGVLAGIILVLGPFLATVIRSLLYWDVDGTVSVTLLNFTNLLGDPRFLEAARNTLLCGVGATVFSCVLGVSLAWIVSRTDVPGRGWFEVANLIPFFLSPYVGAEAWRFLAAPGSGILHRLAEQYFGLKLPFLNIYGLGGVIWVLSIFYTPYVYLFVISPLRRMDSALEDAARVHGASFVYTLRRITLPLLMPALLSAAMIVFVTSAGLFDVPFALAATHGIRTVPTEIYSSLQYPSDFGRASAFGMLMLCLTVSLTLWQRHYLAARRFETVSGKGYRPRIIVLSPLGKVAALGLELLFVGVGVVLPIIALIMVSLQSIWTGQFRTGFFTFDNFSYVLLNYDLTRTAIGNSLILAVTGASIGVGLSVLQSYFLTRGPARGRGFIEAVLSLPIGIPGIILGLGFLILAVRTPLYSTLWIILIAYVAHFFPLAVRTVTAMLVAINPELEQSARASGATWWQTMRYVLLPLLKPALIAAWLMLFVIFIRELGSTILLFGQGTETISVALVALSERDFGFVAALAMIQVVLLLSAFALFRVTRTSLVQD